MFHLKKFLKRKEKDGNSSTSATSKFAQRCLPFSIDKNSHIFNNGENKITKDFLLINYDYPNKKSEPYTDNMIKSNKYTLINFVPKQVLFQFKKFANSYFLIISILQMIPGWSTTGSYTTIIPLLIFISISVLREGYDDYRRYKLDLKENKNQTTIIFMKDQNKHYSKKLKFASLKFWKNFAGQKNVKLDKNIGIMDKDFYYKKSESDTNDVFYMANQNKNLNVDIKKTEWHNLRVGDLVIISNNESIPADLLILSSTNMENNEVYLETMALDGETNLKAKNAHQELYKECYSTSSLLCCQALLEMDMPNSDLYNFNGNLKKLNDTSGSWNVHPITLDNVCLRGSTLRNTNKMLGLVIYTGEETKIRMNSIKSPRIKSPKLQRKINMIVIFMAFTVAAMSLFSFLGAKIYMSNYIFNSKAWYLMDHGISTAASVMGYIIMYNTLIPLSLYVTMEIIKLMQSKLMEWDIDMYYKPLNISMESRTATILEELGQVSYIFSDKTGTLTDNLMVFKKFNIAGTNWEHIIENDQISKPTGNYTFAQNLLSSSSINDASSTDQTCFQPRISTKGGKTSIDFNNTGSTSYFGRPSIASIIEHKYSKTISEEEETGSCVDLKDSFINPNSKSFDDISDLLNFNSNIKNKKPDLQEPKLKTTIDLIRYVQQYPETVFSRKVNFFLLCLSLCHTCLPKREKRTVDGLNSNNIEYQSASPDELALIIAARDMGYVMINKSSNIITLKTYPDGFEKSSKNISFEILNVIEFNSDRKRMSVILKKQNGANEKVEEEILLVCKGADNIIFDRLENPKVTSMKIEKNKIETEERKNLQNEALLDQRKSLEVFRNSNSHSFFSGIPRSSLATSNGNINTRTSHLGRPSGLDFGTRASISLQQMRNSISRVSMDRRSYITSLEDGRNVANNIDALVEGIEKINQDVKNIGIESKREQHKEQIAKYTNPNNNLVDEVVTKHGKNSSKFYQEMQEYIGDETLLTNDEYVLESCLQAIDTFSTEGLRTLLYSYKIVAKEEYEEWAIKYHQAKTSVENRKIQIDTIGGEIETNLKLLAATAIEDKLQDGVPEAIGKFKRAGIKMWMLTGDKRETAINIGYSCNLIHEYSSLVVLDKGDSDLITKMLSTVDKIVNEAVAHCVVVVDGQTLVHLESLDMSIFYDLCMKCDSVIVCRASPSQKAEMVKSVKSRDCDAVTLAVGDGANDIAMIQSADIGIGIAGKEGLQASRTSDYSIGQFRFLLKLLLVHGRYNYSRTSLFVLGTFYKETLFYLSQMIFQRWTMFSGTSLYEPWSLSMFNTLFTSLPVLCVGMFHKDLKASTLLAIPELYTFGRLSQCFNFKIFVQWLLMAALSSVFIMFTTAKFWGESAIKDCSLYPLGFINFTAVVLLINVKLQFIEMRNRSPIEFACTIISCGGWFVWTCFLPAIYSDDVMIYDVKYGFFEHFGKDPTMWATILVAFSIPLIFDMLLKVVINIINPSDLSIFAQLEQNDEIRKKMEFDSYLELQQGWTWVKDPSTFTRYQKKFTTRSVDKNNDKELEQEVQDLDLDNLFKVKNSKTEASFSFGENGELKNVKKSSRRNTLLSAFNEPKSINKDSLTDFSKFEILPSGKIIRKKLISGTNSNINTSSSSLLPSVSDSMTNIFAKTLKFKTSKNNLNDDEIQAIIAARIKELEDEE